MSNIFCTFVALSQERETDNRRYKKYLTFYVTYRIHSLMVKGMLLTEGSRPARAQPEYKPAGVIKYNSAIRYNSAIIYLYGVT